MTSNTYICKQIRLAVLGAAGVGKSAMIVRFITGRFLHHYDPTLEDEYSVETEVEGNKCDVSILDTAGVVSIFIAASVYARQFGLHATGNEYII